VERAVQIDHGADGKTDEEDMECPCCRYDVECGSLVDHLEKDHVDLLI